MRKKILSSALLLLLFLNLRYPTSILAAPIITSTGVAVNQTPWVIWITGTDLSSATSMRLIDTTGTQWGPDLPLISFQISGTNYLGSQLNNGYTPPSGCNDTKPCTISVSLVAADGSLSNIFSLNLPPANICSLPSADQSTIKQYASERGLNFGSFINECLSGIPDENICKATLNNEFGGMTVPFDVPWKSIEPSQGTFDFSTFDTYINYAKNNNLKLHYYHLLWDFVIPGYTEQPTWLFPGRTTTSCGTRTKSDLESILKDYIQTTVSRSGSTVTTWNVVNEAFGADGNPVPNCYYQILGNDYIDQAFYWARAASPNAVLVISDAFGRDGNTQRVHIDGVFNYIKSARARGVPIDAVGVENHLQMPLSPDYLNNLNYILGRAKDAGVKLIISEMDVSPATLNGSQDEIATIYKQTVNTCLNDTNCSSFYVFGISDKYSWLRLPAFQFLVGYAGVKPLLFDETYARKPAYYGVMGALKENTTRACNNIAKSGDLDGNGTVDIFDYNTLASKFGNPYTLSDYNNLVANFGK